jgi:hypothetical protein
MTRNIQHGHIYLPPMTGEQAYLITRILDSVVQAIWDIYADDMADYQGRVFPDAPKPRDAVPARDYPTGDSNF